MDQRPEQPPEGKLIADAAARNDLSIREAARRAGISYGRWRQIVMGYQNVSPGEFAAVHAPARTVAKMAAVVGVTPEQMDAEGKRPDAAEILAEIIRQRADSRIAAPIAAPPASERSSLIAELAPQVAAKVRPVAEQIAARAEVAQAARPGVPVRGEWVFPRDTELAVRWDRVTATGFVLYPASGFPLEDIAEALALREVLEGRSGQDNAASGLITAGVTP